MCWDTRRRHFGDTIDELIERLEIETGLADYESKRRKRARGEDKFDRKVGVERKMTVASEATFDQGYVEYEFEQIDDF